MIRKGFKVLALHEGGQLTSFSEMVPVVVYEEDRWARPFKGDGPLCVFTNKGDAMLFAWSFRNDQNRTAVIYECEYEPSRGKYAYFYDWKGERAKQSKYKMFAGKALARKVKITRRICGSQDAA